MAEEKYDIEDPELPPAPCVRQGCFECAEAAAREVLERGLMPNQDDLERFMLARAEDE